MAEVFAFSTRPLLQAVVSTPPTLAIDLGCGPGYTTRLLAEVTRCTRAIGIDSSEHFLSLATRHAPAHVSFVCHDVAQVPFPTGPADLIFCRLLLTHLQDPLSAVERWGTQLRPQGLLLLEEVEWIRTKHPILRQYLEIVSAILRQQANELYIGSLLEQQEPIDGLIRRMSRVYHLPVNTVQAASMFSLNIPSWKNHPFVQQRYGTIIEQLERDVQTLADHATDEGENVWGMRQIAYERV
ncbi:MAG: class I SAM-dependent methyltransferase [Ktedonobacterales bacterium]